MDALRLPERLAARHPGRFGDDGRPVVSLGRLHGVITPTTCPVPRSVINESIHQEGAAPEPLFVMNLFQGLGLPLPKYELEHEHS